MIFDDVAQWCDEVLVDTAPRDFALKAGQEMVEFLLDPSPEEAADVVIALVGYVNALGRPHGLEAEVIAKYHVNRGRAWVRLGDGTYRHVEDDHAHR